MEYRKFIYGVAFVATLFTSSNLRAQSSESMNTLPLHIEAQLGAGTSCKSVTPFDVNIDLNYTLARRFSIHAITQTSYFLPKDGITSKYNRATNLGGGIGYTFLPQKDDKLGNFELRASVTTSVGSSDFKNTSYNIGIHWYGHAERHKLVPTIGIGYSFRDFSNKNMPNHNGLYFSVGVRF